MMNSQLMNQVRQARAQAAQVASGQVQGRQQGQGQPVAVGRRQDEVDVGACGIGVGQFPGLNIPQWAQEYVYMASTCPTAFSIIADSTVAPQTIEVICDVGLFLWCGLSSCNECNEIMLMSLRTGSSTRSRFICPVDAAAYNTIECFCPFAGGCITSASPARLTFAASGNPSVPPVLNLTAWGCAFETDACISPFDWYGGGFPGQPGGPAVPMARGNGNFMR